MSYNRQANRLLNKAHREKNFTYYEWRTIFQPTLIRVARDITRRLYRCRATQRYKSPSALKNFSGEADDVFQTLELFFFVAWMQFMVGTHDDYLFPPEPGLFYKVTYNACKDNFMPVDQAGRKKTDPYILVYSMSLQKIIDMESSYEFHEQREARLRADIETDLKKYLQEHLGLEDEFGPEFMFWWLGASLGEVAAVKAAAGQQSGISLKTVSRRLGEAFKKIEAKYGITRAELNSVRLFSREFPNKQ